MGDRDLEFNQEGLLIAGLHECNLEILKDNFVNKFETSQTRRKIFEQFESWIHMLLQDYQVYEVWADGSFVTNKINPNDIDVVLFVHAVDYIRIYKNWDKLRDVELVDAYISLAVCEESKKYFSEQEYCTFVNNRNYWRGQFGFDRSDNPKGFLVLKNNDLKMGGDFACQ